ncbi:hypothetical protein MBLNU459_g0041t1 [Dothideomycetes sp. NU459]
MSSSTNPWRETPLVESSALSKAAGCRIFLKLENLQPSGSFKSRGIGYYLQRAIAESPAPERTHFFASSGGNAGLACVHAARSLSRPATVIVPLSTKPLMLAKLRAAGASQVVQHGATWKDADTYLRETVLPEADRNGEVGIYVPPFDHPNLWTGHATLVSELKVQMEQMCGEGAAPDAVVCSVGGGGLLNGIMEGAERLYGGWKDMTVLAVETKGADSLAESISQGQHVTLAGITSQATSLGATKVCDRTYELATTNKQVKSVVLSDDEAAMGCWRLADDERLIVELACGVNVALCYGGRLEKALGRPVNKSEKVVIVVCGGNAVTIDMIAGWKQEFGNLGDELSKSERATVPSAVTMTNGTMTNGIHH